jgi:hypothetical protein
MTAKEEFKEKCDSLHFKPNPNKFPIIDKYNYKIFQKNKFDIFDLLEKALEEYCIKEDNIFVVLGDNYFRR